MMSVTTNAVRDELGVYYLIGVMRLDENYFESVAQLFGLRVLPVSLGVYQQIQAEPRSLSGVRSESNRLGWMIRDWRGDTVLTAEVELPPRSFDDRIITPTIYLALIASLIIWSLAAIAIQRTLVSPVVATGDTLKKILEERNYDRQVPYKRSDELGRLIHYCNTLLKMVSNHTAELRQMSLTDALTGLDNRRGFEMASEKYWGLAMRSNVSVGLLALDIDHFKAYNDHYGHPAGDEVIRRVAGVLARVFKRTTDVTARVGGEEFVVMTLDMTPEELSTRAEKVLELLRREQIEHVGNGAQGIVTASIGALNIPPSGERQLADALKHVDELLYEAKSTGRNRVVAYS